MMEGKTCTMCTHGKWKGKCTTSKVGFVLVMIGALNWGLTGLGGLIGTNLNAVNLIFGAIPWLENVIYLVVGLAAIALLIGCRCKKCRSCCHDGEMSEGTGMEQKMQ